MYLWLKAFHIIFMVAWFAGLFYLPRLFVYHAMVSKDEEPLAYERFCTMERKLYRGIMAPGAILTIFLGIGLIHSLHLTWGALPLWLSLKLGAILLLIFFHLYCGRVIKLFKNGQNPHSARFYRYFNEFPTLILAASVLLVLFKPS